MKNLLWIFIILHFCSVIKVSKSRLCLGKIKIPLEDFQGYTLLYQLNEALILKNFDVMPHETILENNDYTLIVKMIYNDEIPTIDFGASSSLGTYRLEFLYFLWFDKKLSKGLPFELHAIFCNTEVKNFETAVEANGANNLVVFAYGLELSDDDNTTIANFANFQNQLKAVTTGLTQISLENQSLNDWLASDDENFILYKGSLPLFNCSTITIYIDFLTKIKISSELLRELELLKTINGSTLMEQYKPFIEPKGALMTNYGYYAKYKELMDNAKEKEIKEEDTGLNGSSENSFDLLWKLGIFIVFICTIILNI